jgi:hypothetical protein
MADEYEDRSRRRPARRDNQDFSERPQRRPPREQEDEAEEERPRRRRPRYEDDEEDERERRPRKKKRRKRFADCPHCDCRGDADRVTFTWWGGFVGPALLSHVRCRECGYCYNGKTGSDNVLNIILYISIPLAVLALIAAWVYLWR